MYDELQRLADRLIRELLFCEREISEGFVRTVGPPGYRRLDFGERALAYVRVRPKKGFVRIDVPGSWRSPISSRLSVPAANGWALAIRCDADLAEAVQAISTAVSHARGRSPSVR
jgi:hypothetical protein